jgi:hypothetical protein
MYLFVQAKALEILDSLGHGLTVQTNDDLSSWFSIDFWSAQGELSTR